MYRRRLGRPAGCVCTKSVVFAARVQNKQRVCIVIEERLFDTWLMCHFCAVCWMCEFLIHSLPIGWNLLGAVLGGRYTVGGLQGTNTDYLVSCPSSQTACDHSH